MLCPFCEGTEHSPRPHSLLSHHTGEVSAEALEASDCATCGKQLWEICASCAGEGRKLHIIGQCSRCGNSIIYCLPCTDCRGTGKQVNPAHNCVPERAPKVTRIKHPAIAPQPRAGRHIGL